MNRSLLALALLVAAATSGCQAPRGGQYGEPCCAADPYCGDACCEEPACGCAGPDCGCCDQCQPNMYESCCGDCPAGNCRCGMFNRYCGCNDCCGCGDACGCGDTCDCGGGGGCGTYRAGVGCQTGYVGEYDCSAYENCGCGRGGGCCVCGGCTCGCCNTGPGCCCSSGDHNYNFAPGPPVGQTAYPYYTVRGPRDFLMSNPPPLGPY